jgi:hypothetical protein
LNYVDQRHPNNIINETNLSIIKEFVKLYDEKGTYLNALFGPYGSNHFLEQYKEKLSLFMPELKLSEKKPITPYLIEFHNSIGLSLFQLWQRRKKDLSIEDLADLIIRLYTKGISAFL